MSRAISPSLSLRRARVSSLAAGILLVVLGVGLVTVAAAGLAVRFVQPAYVPWVGLSGLVLLACGWWTASASRVGGPAQVPRVWWVLLFPALLLVAFVPASLPPSAVVMDGALAAAVEEPAADPDPAAHQGEAQEVSLRQLVRGDLADGARVRTVGMVYPQGEGWLLVRYRIVCCAADAVPYGVAVQAPVPKAQWVEVTGTVQGRALLHARVRGVAEPERPYL